MGTKTSSGKRFAPKKSFFFQTTTVLIYNTLILISQFIIWRPTSHLLTLTLIALGFLLPILGYYIWQWKGTYYELQDGQLFYRSGFTKGHIPVNSIRKIETHTRGW